MSEDNKDASSSKPVWSPRNNEMVQFPSTAGFRLTQFESTLLQSDLQRRVNSWNDQWVKNDNVIVERTKSRERGEREMLEMHPTNDGSHSLRFLMESTDKMTRLVDDMQYLILADSESLESSRLQATWTNALTTLNKARRQAMRCRESAKNVPWRLVQPIPASSRASTLKSIKQLPVETRSIALNVIAAGRQLREFESQNGAVPKHSVETHTCGMIFQGWKEYLHRLLQDDNQALPVGQKSACVPDDNGGLEPPPVIQESDALPDEEDETGTAKADFISGDLNG